MSNPNPERDERVRQIRERQARCMRPDRDDVPQRNADPLARALSRELRQAQTDRGFLLSLLDSQAATIPYCLNCWHAVPHNGPAGTVDDACTHEGCNCGYYTPAPSEDAATRMRDRCVAKVREIDSPSDTATDFDVAYRNGFESARDAAIEALQSLTLEQGE